MSSRPIRRALALGALIAVLEGQGSAAAAADEPRLAAAQAEPSRPSADEALRLLFPGAEIARDVVYLSEEQRARAAEFAGAAIESRLVQRASAWKEGVLVGNAYLDTHRVRTLEETLLVGVDPARRVLRVECLAFAEPAEYAPRASFYAQFPGKALGPELSLKRDIRGIGGATLSARATTDAVRRVLALHQVLAEAAPPPRPVPAPAPTSASASASNQRSGAAARSARGGR